MKDLLKRVIAIKPRTKGIVIVSVAYVMIMITTLSSGATTQIKNYIEAISVSVVDGQEEKKDYLVQQDTVEHVLEEIDVQLTEQDFVDKELNYIVKKDDLLTITRVSNQIVDEISVVPSKEVTKYDGLHLFQTEVTQKGQDGEIQNTFNVTYQNGKEVSKEITETKVLKEASDTIVSVGSVQPGAYFTGRLTTYGGDCGGCSGMSASGISLSPTTGVNYSNTGKLSYNGRQYYALAADPSIPFGTVIKITNHILSIEDVAYGIVVDRGGAIRGNKIDIFKGSQTGGTTYFSGGTSTNAKFEIVSVGSGRNFWR